VSVSSPPATRPDVMSVTTMDAVRRNGIVLAVGTALWIPVLFGYDSGDPGSLPSRAFNLAGLVFQVAAFTLLLTMSGTFATGSRLAGRALLRVAQTILAIAMVSTVLTTIFPFDSAPDWVLMTDLFWPLSMLGLFVVGITVAAVGRWRGELRVWPLLAGSWLLVAMPIDSLLGEDTLIGMVVMGLWTAATFPVLGIMLARRPELTGVTR